MKNSPVKNAVFVPAVSGVTGETVASDDRHNFRRLKRNELVRIGDYVEDGHQGFELWEGPSGFWADSFVKAIYRRETQPMAEAGKAA